MADREKKIGDVTVKCEPWGFMALMERKRKLLKLAEGGISNFGKLIGGETTEDISVSDVILIIKDIVDTFDEKNLDWFIKTMLEKVTVDGEPMQDMQTMDKYLSGRTTLFYDICLHVLEVNFGDFLERIGLKINSK
jgi:hypothetical protein